LIFGSDDREILGYSQTAPSAAAVSVQITSYYKNGRVLCGSGTIIGANDVLTAAHMVYSAENGGYPEYIEVTPYRFGDTKPFGIVYSTSYNVPTAWIANSDYIYDYALLKLDRAIGYYTGYATPYVLDDYSLDVVSYGYPGDLKDGESIVKTKGGNGFLAGGVVKYSNLDALSGQSGSGVFLDDGGAKVIGVISHETLSPGYNAISPITKTAYSQITNWARENDSNLALRPTTDASLIDEGYALSLFYYGYLGRAPDKTGLDYWLSALVAGSSLLEISKSFFNSQEYVIYDGITPQSLEAFVGSLYQKTLGRSADEAGLNFWVTAMINGVSKAEVAMNFVLSGEYEKKNALNLYQIWHREYQDFALEAHGSAMAETLIASSLGDSMLYGADANDTLIGGAYNDYLWGGTENDTLTGGAGADFFAWDIGEGVDKVLDFDYTQDFVRLRNTFDWNFGTSSDGWLSIKPTNGSGELVLSGISPTISGFVAVV